jgi:hypothetical protein
MVPKQEWIMATKLLMYVLITSRTHIAKTQPNYSCANVHYFKSSYNHNPTSNPHPPKNKKEEKKSMKENMAHLFGVANMNLLFKLQLIDYNLKNGHPI